MIKAPSLPRRPQVLLKHSSGSVVIFTNKAAHAESERRRRADAVRMCSACTLPAGTNSFVPCTPARGGAVNLVRQSPGPSGPGGWFQTEPDWNRRWNRHHHEIIELFGRFQRFQLFGLASCAYACVGADTRAYTRETCSILEPANNIHVFHVVDGYKSGSKAVPKRFQLEPKVNASAERAGKPCDINKIAGGYALDGVPMADLRLFAGAGGEKFRGRRAWAMGAVGAFDQAPGGAAGNGGNPPFLGGGDSVVGMASLECAAETGGNARVSGHAHQLVRLIAPRRAAPRLDRAEAPPAPPSAPRRSPSMWAQAFFWIWIETCSIPAHARLTRAQSLGVGNGSGFARHRPVSGARGAQKFGRGRWVARGRGHGMSVETCGRTAKVPTLWGGLRHVN